MSRKGWPYAGGRGMAFDTQTNVMAKPLWNRRNFFNEFIYQPCGISALPTKPLAMKNRDTYRPAVDMVERAMMNPRIAPHHQPTMWKNLSPVLS